MRQKRLCNALLTLVRHVFSDYNFNLPPFLNSKTTIVFLQSSSQLATIIPANPEQQTVHQVTIPFISP
jgi:hypothetical protein